MSLERVDEAIAVCWGAVEELKESRKKESGERDNEPPEPPIELSNYLTGYLLTLIYATFETELRSIAKKRLCNTQDEKIAFYVSKKLERQFNGRIRIENLEEFLNCCEKGCGKKFKEKLDKETSDGFESLVGDRHALAHTGSLKLTLDDLIGYYKRGKGVLDAFSEAINGV